jgi:putative transposase
MQRRRRKRFRAEARVPLTLPTRANEVWTIDYTREALRIEPDTSLPGLRVARILEGLRERPRDSLAIVKPIQEHQFPK